MKFDEIIKRIKKHEWWSEEAPGCVQTIFYPLHAFIGQSKVFHPEYLSVCVIGYKRNFFYERTPEGEKWEVYKYIFEQMKKDLL